MLVKTMVDNYLAIGPISVSSDNRSLYFDVLIGDRIFQERIPIEILISIEIYLG